MYNNNVHAMSRGQQLTKSMEGVKQPDGFALGISAGIEAPPCW